MRYATIIIISAVLIATILIWKSAHNNTPLPKQKMDSNIMQLTSPAFANNNTIPKEYTCDGQNISPPLSFENVPSNTRSLVLIMDDHDVPKNLVPSGIFDHWVVFNIPSRTKGAAANEILTGIYGSNSSGKPEYTGPCPPDKEHRYIFTLYALDSILSLQQGASKDEVLKALNGHIIAEAILIGRFNREKNQVK